MDLPADVLNKVLSTPQPQNRGPAGNRVSTVGIAEVYCVSFVDGS